MPTTKKKIIMIGPFSPPYGGEALAFKVVFDGLPSSLKKLLIDKAKYNGSKFYNLINPIYFVIKILYFSFFSKKIYMTSGSNKLGKLRDILIFIVSYIFRHEVICHVHGSAYLKLSESSILDKVLIKSLRSFSKIILLSESFRTKFNYINKSNIEIVPNSIFPNTPNFEISSKLDKYTDEKINLLYMSHVLPSKGLYFILEALLLLKDEIPFTFYFAGNIISENGYSETNIADKIREYKSKLKDSFVIQGFVSNEKKWQLLSEAHIFLLPTSFHAEGLPISIIEAMYFGNAIISTNWRAIPDLVVNKVNGFLVKPEDHLEIYDSILYLYKNRQILMDIGKRNTSKIEKDYSYNLFRDKMERIILN